MSTKICVIARDVDLYEKMRKECEEKALLTETELSLIHVVTVTATMDTGIMILNYTRIEGNAVSDKYTMTLKSLVDETSVTVPISSYMFETNCDEIVSYDGVMVGYSTDEYYKFEHDPSVEFLESPIVRIVLPDDLDPINDSIEICSILRKYGDYIPNNENDSDESDLTLIPLFYKPVMDKLESIVSKLLLGYGYTMYDKRIEWQVTDSEPNKLLSLPVGERSKYIVDKEIDNCNRFYPEIERLHQSMLNLISSDDNTYIDISDDLDIMLSEIMDVLSKWGRESYILKSKNFRDMFVRNSIHNEGIIRVSVYLGLKAAIFRNMKLTRRQLINILNDITPNIRALSDIEPLSDFATIKNLIG